MLGYEQNLNGTETDLSGWHIAEVVDNKDPKALERVLVRVIGVHDMTNKTYENALWAQHVAPSKRTGGEIPNIGDFIYVTFLQGDSQTILWHGWVRGIQG